MLDLKADEYLAGLPDVETSRLPQGTLFWAKGRLYQVTETGHGGYHKAREWRKTEETDVALVRGSFPSRHLPLIERGKLMPVHKSRLDLTNDGEASCFVFPNEELALDAAYLDVALIQNAGAYVRNQGHEPAFAATDGVHVFRLYYYRESARGRMTNLASLRNSDRPFKPQPHTEGPVYWRLLPSWTEITRSPDVTQEGLPVVRGDDTLDETIPNTPVPPTIPD